MIRDETKRIPRVGMPTASRSVLEVNEAIPDRPTYTFFFTMEDTGPIWPCFETPDVTLHAPEDAVLRRSTALFDAWVMSVGGRNEYLVDVLGPKSLEAPWTIILLEQVGVDVQIEVHQLESRTLAYRSFVGTLREGFLHLRPIKYQSSEHFVPELAVSDLLAVLVWHNQHISRQDIDRMMRRVPGGLFSHIRHPVQEDAHRVSGISGASTGSCASTN